MTRISKKDNNTVSLADNSLSARLQSKKKRRA